jgi:hypothetical protein
MFSMDIAKDIGITAVLWHLIEHGFEVQQVAKEKTVARGHGMHVVRRETRSQRVGLHTTPLFCIWMKGISCMVGGCS